jgi:hypothetical protein
MQRMYGRLFTLTSAEDQNLIFAWGMEIIGTGEREAVIYRRDPVTRQTLHAVHDSAEAALARYTGRPEPMSLVWMDVPVQVDNLWELLDTALNG